MSLIDHHSPIPLYEQIRQILERRITEHIYSLDSLLPPENDLAEEFGVTRLTVRQATEVLKRKGYLESRRGQGTRIKTPPLEQNLHNFYSFGHRYQDPNLRLSTTLLSLKKDPQEEGYSVLRLRLLDKRPLALEQSWIPIAIAPDLENYDLETQSLYGILEEVYGIEYGKSQEYLEPVLPKPVESKYLEILPGQPALQTYRTTFDTQNRIIEIRTTLVRPDRVRFRSDLVIERKPF
ncbi:MAG: GntR family transcriptional regulator [Spirochaetales bacterium]|nr:GntR family transcriptional regulator [Spirochaetales bacterium]